MGTQKTHGQFLEDLLDAPVHPPMVHPPVLPRYYLPSYVFGEHTTGMTLLVTMTEIVTSPHYTGDNKFQFVFKNCNKKNFEVIAHPTAEQPGNALVAFHDYVDVTYDHIVDQNVDAVEFAKYYKHFLGYPVYNDDTPNMVYWQLSVLLNFEIARRFPETIVEDHPYYGLQVAFGIAAAIDLNMSIKRIVAMFCGYRDQREAAIKGILDEFQATFTYKFFQVARFQVPGPADLLAEEFAAGANI